MMPLDDKQRHEWLMRLYAEAWTEYRHEDELILKRTTQYLTTQGAIVAVFAIAVAPVVKTLLDQWMAGKFHDVRVLAIVSDVVAIGVFALLILLTRNVKLVSAAGRTWINMRWIPILAIERELGLDRNVLIAHLEDDLRGKRGEAFFPFGADKTSNLRPEALAAKSLVPPPIRGGAWYQASTADLLMWMYGTILVILIAGLVKLIAFCP